MTSEVLVDGDFNGHVGSDMGGSGEVHGGLLDWAVGKGLHLMNTCFQKKSQLITFKLGETETMIIYILVNNNYIGNVKDFFKLGFTPCKAEQPLQGTELQEKETQKD